MNRIPIAMIAGCVLFSTGSIAANAQGIVETTSVKVYPHELATVDGRQLAIDRIQHAASRLCRPDNPLIGGSKQRQCEVQATEDMVRQTRSPELLAQWQRIDEIRTASRN